MYEMNGYNQKTGELAFSADVPESRSYPTLRIAGVPLNDDGLGSYPLDIGQSSEIASTLGVDISRFDLDFFLEPCEIIDGIVLGDALPLS